MVASAAVFALSGALAPVPASAGVAYGNPNWCTHSKSTAYGLIGYTIVQYKSGRTVGSKHRHTANVTYVAYASTTTSGPRIQQETITRDCDS